MPSKRREKGYCPLVLLWEAAAIKMVAATVSCTIALHRALLRVFCLNSVILTTTQWNRYPCFTDESEAQRGKVTCPKSHSYLESEHCLLIEQIWDRPWRSKDLSGLPQMLWFPVWSSSHYPGCLLSPEKWPLASYSQSSPDNRIFKVMSYNNFWNRFFKPI